MNAPSFLISLLPLSRNLNELEKDFCELPVYFKHLNSVCSVWNLGFDICCIINDVKAKNQEKRAKHLLTHYGTTIQFLLFSRQALGRLFNYSPLSYCTKVLKDFFSIRKWSFMRATLEIKNMTSLKIWKIQNIILDKYPNFDKSFDPLQRKWTNEN